MARYQVFPNADARKVLQNVDRLRCHHDHLKTLDNCYAFMRQKETYDRMRDPEFRCDDPDKMNELDRAHFTSLIVKLSPEQGEKFFLRIRQAYEQIGALLRRFDDRATVEIYFDSAHITIKSLQDGLKQDADALGRYFPVILPIVRKWIDRFGTDTSLYAVGLFTNLSKEKGLSIGVRFYPSLPLVQIIRGEVGAALYAHGSGLALRVEGSFHTMLTHSTGFRARNLSLPMSTGFIKEFQTIVESYDATVFGAIQNIQVADVYVRNGRSDKLVTVAEVSCADENWPVP